MKEFEYYNPNPLDKETGDCVVRALCKATNLSWLEVYNELCEYGREYYTMPNSPDSYERFLKEHGFIRVKIPTPKKGQKSLSVKALCKQDGTFICRCAHHLVCVKDNHFHDLNNASGNCKVYTYWTNNR